MDLKRGKTGLVYDLRMTEHRCLWNSGYPECPERFTRILDRCNELKLIERCHAIPSRPATLSEILLKHTQKHYDLLKAVDGETDERVLEEMCTHYDVFVHPSTFQLSLLAVGCAIELVDKILLGEVQNGMAVIRPPGHHAMETRFDGFCFFNNVAIAAQFAINNHGVKRVLIVDFDVHHGQATQQLFYDDPRVLYFSVHRFEHGIAFPGLRESDFDYVGEGKGKGFNFNVPLNKAGMTNSDYLSVWQQILLPVAIEYQPELVLISAGYDAAYGCPLGEMEITPACYAHLVSPLMTLAEGKIGAFLEGGYNLDSLSESAAITLRTFLGDPCPLLEMLDEPCDSVQDSILNCIQTHRAFWKCLQVHEEYRPEALIAGNSNFHQVTQKFIVDKELNHFHNREIFDPHGVFPNQTRSKEDQEKVSEHLQYLKGVTNLGKPVNRTCFVSPEKSGSRERVQQFLLKRNLSDELHGLKEEGHNFLSKFSSKPTIKFIDPNFLQSSKAEATLELLHNVLEDRYFNGIYIEFAGSVSPSVDMPHSTIDNVGLAAQYAVEVYGVKRALIVDFSKNNIQHIETQLNPNRSTLYVSLDHGGDSKDVSRVFNGSAVNIPMSKASDSDYVAAFQRIIMPIAYEFNPELVLVSADFDATHELFESNNLSHETFGYLTHWLSALANGRVIIFVKGECNATAACVKALLGDPIPLLKSQVGSNIGNIEIIRNVISVQQEHWKWLKFIKLLPAL